MSSLSEIGPVRVGTHYIIIVHDRGLGFGVYSAVSILQYVVLDCIKSPSVQEDPADEVLPNIEKPRVSPGLQRICHTKRVMVVPGPEYLLVFRVSYIYMYIHMLKVYRKSHVKYSGPYIVQPSAVLVLGCSRQSGVRNTKTHNLKALLTAAQKPEQLLILFLTVPFHMYSIPPKPPF